MFRGLEPTAKGEPTWRFHDDTGSWEHSIYFIYAFLSFHFHIVVWHFMSTLRWTLVCMLCFDNGGVHRLLVGSEPTHCNGYVSIYILLIILYPTLGRTPRTLKNVKLNLQVQPAWSSIQSSHCHAPGFGTRLVRGLGELIRFKLLIVFKKKNLFKSC